MTTVQPIGASESTSGLPIWVSVDFARPLVVAVLLTLAPSQDVRAESPLLTACVRAQVGYFRLARDESEDGGEALCEHLDAIDLVARLPASNLRELQAKAAVLITHFATDGGGGFARPPRALAASLLRDAGVAT